MSGQQINSPGPASVSTPTPIEKIRPIPIDAKLTLPPALSDELLETRDDIHTGRLENGFEYVILRNDPGKQDFLAHLEVRVGSVDETDDEQGIAHFLEHAVFGGTTEYPSAEIIRTVLSRWGMSFGGDTNAFTDFRRTVYTFQAPSPPDLENKNTTDVIRMLYELMFNAILDESYIDNERKAVLSEEQMRNTVDYRSEVVSYRQMHARDLLPNRFPIGLVRLIEGFRARDLRRFYEKHYTPDRMTLYMVGCLDPEVAIAQIRSTFGGVTGEDPHRGGDGSRDQRGIGDCGPLLAPRLRFSPINTSRDRPDDRVVIYQHDLIHQVTFHVKVLEETMPATSMSETVINLIDSVISQALDTRVNAQYLGSANPAFTGWNWMFTDSHRDDCALNILAISCEAESWERGVRAGVQAAHQMALYGMSPLEFKHSLAAVIRASAEEAAQRETIPHSSLIENLMEDVNLGCTIQDPLQMHEALLQAVEHTTLERVNIRCAEVLSFIRDYDSPDSRSFIFVTCPSSIGLTSTDVIRVVDAALDASSPPADVLVPDELLSLDAMIEKMACIRPHFVRVVQGVDDDTSSVGTSAYLDSTFDARSPLDSGADLDDAGSSKAGDDMNQEEKEEEKEKKEKGEKDKEEGVEGVSLTPLSPREPKSTPTMLYDPATEIYRRRLSNGVCVSYKSCSFDAQRCTIRITALGGRVREPTRYPTGAVPVALATMMDSAAGGHSSDVLARYCALHAIDVDYKLEAERTVITIGFGVSMEESLSCAFSLLHLYLNESHLDEEAFERCVRESILSYEEDQLDSVTVASNATATALIPGDVRFHPLGPLALRRLTREHCADALAYELRPENLDVTIVGEFGDVTRLEHFLLHFVGTLTPRTPQGILNAPPPSHSAEIQQPSPVPGGIDTSPAGVVTPSSVAHTPVLRKGPHVTHSDMENFDILPIQRSVFIHHHVTEEAPRAIAYLAWPTCNAWGFKQAPNGDTAAIDWASELGGGEGDDVDMVRLRNPMFTQRVSFVLREVVNNRLFRELRERDGHTYTASYSPALLSYYKTGFNYVTMQMFPGQIKESIAALYRVLASLRSGISQAEVDEAIGPLAASAQTGLRTTAVWLALMQDLFSDNVIPKDIDCLHDIVDYYHNVTLVEVQALANHLLNLSTHVLSVGTSGPQAYDVRARREGDTFVVSEHGGHPPCAVL